MNGIFSSILSIQIFFTTNRNLLKKFLEIHPLMGPNGQVYSAKEKAELLANTYEINFPLTMVETYRK